MLACEKAKITLQEEDQTTIEILNFNSGAKHAVEITRDQFQTLINPVLEKFQKTVQTVIEESGLDLN